MAKANQCIKRINEIDTLGNSTGKFHGERIHKKTHTNNHITVAKMGYNPDLANLWR